MDDQMNNNGPVQYQPPQQIGNDKDGYATAILVLGILSICCSCFPCGVISLALRAANKDQISPDKQGLVTAGFVTSIIGVVLWGLGWIVNICIRLAAI